MKYHICKRNGAWELRVKREHKRPVGYFHTLDGALRAVRNHGQHAMRRAIEGQTPERVTTLGMAGEG